MRNLVRFTLGYIDGSRSIFYRCLFSSCSTCHFHMFIGAGFLLFPDLTCRTALINSHSKKQFKTASVSKIFADQNSCRLYFYRPKFSNPSFSIVIFGEWLKFLPVFINCRLFLYHLAFLPTFLPIILLDYAPHHFHFFTDKVQKYDIDYFRQMIDDAKTNAVTTAHGVCVWSVMIWCIWACVAVCQH